MTFLELAEKVLRNAKKPLSSDEIWEKAKERGLDKQVSIKGKTPWATLGARLYVLSRDRRGEPFFAVGSRPKRFYLKGAFTVREAENLDLGQEIPEKCDSRFGYLERDLHPFLAHFAFYYLNAYTKTIYHSKSAKMAFGEWLHPDMVGFYYPIGDWKSEVVELGASIGSQSIKIFSFELKRELTLANLREAFFQSVSNSSWAHESYLVAAEIKEDEEFLSELRRLSAAFGIGVIKIDITDPDSSRILFPAKTKDVLDWETINKLAVNPDFKEFLSRVRIDISSREIRREKYDKILEAESLIASIKKPAA